MTNSGSNIESYRNSIPNHPINVYKINFAMLFKMITLKVMELTYKIMLTEIEYQPTRFKTKGASVLAIDILSVKS